MQASDGSTPNYLQVLKLLTLIFTAEPRYHLRETDLAFCICSLILFGYFADLMTVDEGGYEKQ